MSIYGTCGDCGGETIDHYCLNCIMDERDKWARKLAVIEALCRQHANAASNAGELAREILEVIEK